MQNQYEAIYEEIAGELETGKTEKGLWIRLFAECSGDEQKTKVLYIKQRAEKLISAERAIFESSGRGSALPQANKGDLQHIAENAKDTQDVYYKSVVNAENTKDTQDSFYKAVVGPKNQEYYLSQFSRFDSHGTKNGTWHWPAFFAPFFWFLYRKMWINALIYLLLNNFLIIIMKIIYSNVDFGVNKSSDNTGTVAILVLIAVFTFILPPMYANSLYYKHCKKKIKEANLWDSKKRLDEIFRSGGTSKVALILAIIFSSIIFIGIVAAIVIPAYESYVKKASIAQVPAKLILPYEEAIKITGDSGSLQFNGSSLFSGSLYNGSNYNISHITVEITAKEKNGEVRWKRKFVEDRFIKSLTTGSILIDVGPTSDAKIEWSIVEVEGIIAQ